MAQDEWQSMRGSEISFKWQEKQAGFEIVGYLFDMQHNQGPKQNSSVYTLKQENGENIAFWGSAVLDDQIQKVPMGSFIKVIYEGKKEPKKSSGQPYHSFEVMLHPTKKLDMSANPNTGASDAVEQPQQAAPAQEAPAQAPQGAAAVVDEEDDLPF